MAKKGLADLMALLPKDRQEEFKQERAQAADQQSLAAQGEVWEDVYEDKGDRNLVPHDIVGKNWQSDDDKRFVNPYNFVSFDAKKPPRRKKPKKGELTGWLDCTLTTKTPLIIPDAEEATQDENEHKTMHFFALPDASGAQRPAIPGSTLRGAIRALYESASSSCLPIDAGDDITLSTRLEVSGSAKTRALLCYDKARDTWSLYAVEHDPRDINEKSKEHEQGFRLPDKKFGLQSDGTLKLEGYDTTFTAGQEIHFTTEPGMRTPHKKTYKVPCTDAIPVAEGGQVGYLQFVPPLPSKKLSPRVVARDSNKPPLQTWAAGDDSPSKEIAKVLEFYASNANTDNAKAATGKNDKTTPYDHLTNALKKVRKEGGCLPVWVLEVTLAGGGVDRYLTCSSVGRIIMRNDWAKLLGAFKSCEDMQALCPACRLFGNAYKEASYAGHLRFSDALQRADCTAKRLPMRTLAELASPKPSAAVFYSHRPQCKNLQTGEKIGVRSWNYDYYTTSNDRNQEKEKIAIKHPEKLLLGRKGYWHHNPADSTQSATTSMVTNSANSANQHAANTTPKTKRNCTMEPLDVGAKFVFKIYFEQISQQQLDELIWVCTLGENRPDSNRQQKIGHAKPLGYGSVKITVDAVHTRTLQAQGNTLAYQVNTSDYTQSTHQTIACPFDQASQTMQELLALCDATKTQGVERARVSYPLGSDGKSSGKANENASHQWFAGNKNFYEKCYVMPAPTDDALHLPRIYKK